MPRLISMFLNQFCLTFTKMYDLGPYCSQYRLLKYIRLKADEKAEATIVEN